METYSARDQKIIWHPFTQEKTASPVLPIVRGKGSYLFDENGNSYLDLVSSWWVNLHGHAHPDIAQSIYKQALELEHVIFAGCTHPPAIELCEKLSDLLPRSLSRFFFSDNGSTAVEVSLKLAYQYWQNRGETDRRSFISLEGGYHGDTFGAMSVGKSSKFHDAFSDILFPVFNIPFPSTWLSDTTFQEREERALSLLESYLKTSGKQVAALILEPLIQGASGMRMARPIFFERVIKMVREYDILVVFDEVMTGFGRTGTTFALSQLSEKPDFLCLSKGITGGFMPLALTVTTESIYECFLSTEWSKAFAHGHSYTANPLACSAALASLKLLLSESTQNSIASIKQSHVLGLEEIRKRCRKASKIRTLGTIAAMDIEESLPFLNETVHKLLQRGLIIRPLGKTLYLLPPYSITPQELERSYEEILNCIV
ncbi:MAG: adenosylmethionine--8-amino-7-oxononanoate transaminase [Pseudomonadota bacterium]